MYLFNVLVNCSFLSLAFTMYVCVWWVCLYICRFACQGQRWISEFSLIALLPWFFELRSLNQTQHSLIWLPCYLPCSKDLLSPPSNARITHGSVTMSSWHWLGFWGSKLGSSCWCGTYFSCGGVPGPSCVSLSVVFFLNPLFRIALSVSPG